MSRTLTLSLIAAFLVATPLAHADRPVDAGAVIIAPHDDGSGGSGSGSATSTITTTTTTEIKPNDALHNPATDPAGAWSDENAARKTSWPLAVWAGLAMLGKALAYGRDKLKTVPVIGKLAAWLATGKMAMLVAGVGAVGAAGYDVLMAGGSLVAALVASGVAIAGISHSTTQPTSPPPIA